MGGILLAALLVAATAYPEPRAESDATGHERLYARSIRVDDDRRFRRTRVGAVSLAEAFRQMAASTQELSGGILLALAGGATLLAGLFPIDNTPDGRFNTARGAVHAVAGYLLSLC